MGLASPRMEWKASPLQRLLTLQVPHHLGLVMGLEVSQPTMIEDTENSQHL